MVALQPEPSIDDINQLRKITLKKIEDESLFETLDKRDLDRFNSDDDWIRRFLMHHENDHILASNMALETLKWRKKSGVNDITEEALYDTLVEQNELIIYNRDIDGCKMLIFSVRNHIKNTTDPNKMKNVLLYWIERLEREEKGKWITVFFDMKDAGLKNMDMEFVQYLINLFKYYYPWILNYIMVFEMPWLFNAMWKIIQGWLPPKSINKIKFVNKGNITTYVPKDQCISFWGGDDETELIFVPEEKELLNPIMVNGEDADDKILNDDIKKVHFDIESDSSASEFSPVGKYEMQGFVSDGKLQVEPMDQLIFADNQSGSNATITITNATNMKYMFKIKTTAPDKYRVRPSVGIVSGGGAKVEVGISLSGTHHNASLVRDRFQVVAVPTSGSTSVEHKDFEKLIKAANSSDVVELRIRVGLTDYQPMTVSNHVTPQVPHDVGAKLDKLLQRQEAFENRLECLNRIGHLESRLESLWRILVATLIVLVALTLVILTNAGGSLKSAVCTATDIKEL